MHLQQAPQLAFPLRGHGIRVGVAVVHALLQRAVPVQHPGDSAAHARGEVVAHRAEHGHPAAGHVFTSVVTHTFDDRPGAAVAHRESLAGPAGNEGISAGRAVQRHVADQDILLFPYAVRRRAHRQRSAGQAFAQVVSGGSVQGDLLALRQERAEGLAAAALRLDRPFALQHRTEGPVGGGQVDVVLVQPRVRALREMEVVLCFRPHMRVPGKPNQGGKVRRRPGLLGQQVAPAHQLVHGPCAELRHDLPHILRDEQHEPFHVFRLADKAFPELRVLRRDTEGAGAQLAYAHHPAAHGHQRRRREAELLRAQQQRDHHVMAGHQLAVGFQGHLLAQPVPAQHLVGLRQADLPGQARVVHAAQRRRAGTALSAGDQDSAGAGLRHAAGNRAHPGGGNQLHGHLRLLVGALQVVNQFRKIFNGIDVMVRRRGNQGDPRGRTAGLRHALRHLRAGQVSALAGLCALRHLDLDFLCAQQVFPCHAEAAAGHLLDCGVQLRAEAFRQLAALAAVGASAQAVHRAGQALMGFLRDGAVAHCAGAEALHNLTCAFHLVQRDFPAHVIPEGQHGPDRPRAFIFHPRGILFKGFRTVRPYRLLQQVNRLRAVQVLLGTLSTAQAVDSDGRQAVDGSAECRRMVVPAVLLGFVQVRAAQHARGIRKVSVHIRLVQAHRFKQLRALVRLQGGNAHLRGNFQHAGGQCPVVPAHCLFRFKVHLSVFAQGAHALVRQVRVYGPRAVGRQQRQLVHVPRLAAFQHHGHRRPLLHADQVLLQAGYRQQGRNRQVLRVHTPVGQDQDIHPVGAGPVAFREEPGQRVPELFFLII